MLWDRTLHDVLIEDTTITGATDTAVRYESAARSVAPRDLERQRPVRLLLIARFQPTGRHVHRQFPELTNRVRAAHRGRSCVVVRVSRRTNRRY